MKAWMPRGGNGSRGMNLNIWNNNGPINVRGTVVINLADGGNGGEAKAVCATAKGGDGGKSGNFRMSAAGGINLNNGTLTINPGKAGDGGLAQVDKGMPGADGCPGQAGADGEARGGKGGDQKKRLFARGNVQGLANLTLGKSMAGNGGNAIANACDGGNGTPCCDAGAGGSATATGGKGGDASLDITGLPVTTSGVEGGRGGDAEAGGGNGGQGGDCKFAKGGDGGSGGGATATSGDGGSATAAGGAGGDVGGDSGDATATGGNGGNGGDGTPPGNGGTGGTATATVGAAGTGGTPGTPGTPNATDGADGVMGNDSVIFIWCFPFDFLPDGTLLPGVVTGQILDQQTRSPVGTMDIEFRDVPNAGYFKQSAPQHIGYGSGSVDYRVNSIELFTGTPGEVGGIDLATLSGSGIDQGNPMMVEALDGQGNVVDTVPVDFIPDNQANPQFPEILRILFNTSTPIATIRITVPPLAFVTFLQIYIIDP